MLGAITTNNLGLILEESVHLFKDLPPGRFDKSCTPTAPAAAPKTVSFMCTKQQFTYVVQLAELGVNLAEQSIATTKPPLP